MHSSGLSVSLHEVKTSRTYTYCTSYIVTIFLDLIGLQILSSLTSGIAGFHNLVTILRDIKTTGDLNFSLQNAVIIGLHLITLRLYNRCDYDLSHLPKYRARMVTNNGRQGHAKV